MTRFLLLALGVLLTRAAARHLLVRPAPPTAPHGEPRELVQDPVCATYVSRQTALRTRRGDRVHYFCSPVCQRRFLSAATS